MIREATVDDVPAIVALGQNFIDNSQYRELIGANLSAMAALVCHLIEGEYSEVLVLDIDNSTVGMLGLTLYQHPISGETFATELFWWVEPEFRGRGARLLLEAERWARSRGARALQMIAPERSERDASAPDVAAIYRRLGFVVIETTYQKRLNDDRTEGV